MTQMLKCLECGARISETGLLRIVEKGESGIVSAEQVKEELGKGNGMVSCLSCDGDGNWLVPEDVWKTERDDVNELLLDSQVQLAKAYDRNALKTDDQKVSQMFASRADRLRKSARENREMLNG